MNTNLEKKFEFLKSVKMPSKETILQCLLEYANFQGPSYDAGKYGYFINYKLEDMSSEQIGKYKDIIINPQQKIFSAEIEKMNAESDKDYQIFVEKGDFTHIRIGEQKPIDCRLYLRIMPSNVHKLARILTQKCFQRRLPTHFKFVLNRNDSFVIYTDYEHSQEFVDIIKKIHQEQPKLFRNAEKLHPLWGSIDGFIGFMEEPQIDVEYGCGELDKSASTYRTKFLQDITSDSAFKHPKTLTTSHLQKFLQPLDIDPVYLPLNSSSVQELEKAGYNLSLIGSKEASSNLVK